MGIVAGNIIIGNVADYKQEVRSNVTSTLPVGGRSIRDLLAQTQPVEEVTEEPAAVEATPTVNKKSSKYLRDMFNGNDLISFG